MSDSTVSRSGTIDPGARALLARAAAAEARARRALQAAIDDAFLAPEARLDDRTRAALTGLLEALIGGFESELREQANRLLSARDAATLADADQPAIERLAAAGLFRDVALMAECVARIRVELITAALPAEAPGIPETASLLVRLTASSDGVVAAAASAVLTGESHRRAMGEGSAPAGSGLPGALHERLLWWTAAALRDRASSRAGDSLAEIDRALTEAALRNRAAQHDADRLEAAALRLAQAIAARPDELPMLLDEALRDRRVTLFVALLAHALDIDPDTTRDLVLDPAGDRLWLALRALDLPRATIARIGYRLCEADPRRDVEAFADALDVIASVEPDVAATAIAPLRLHPDYRAALSALARDGA